MAIKVIVNLPQEHLMYEFQERMCIAVAKTLETSKTPEFLAELKKRLKEEVDV